VTAALIELLRRELPALVRQAVRAELAPLLPRPLPGPQRALLDALAAEFSSSPFASREVAAAARSPLALHSPLRAALCDLEIPHDAEKIGRALRKLVGASAGASQRLVRCKDERSAGVWAVEGIDPA
jgi:hypothetical protein